MKRLFVVFIALLLAVALSMPVAFALTVSKTDLPVVDEKINLTGMVSKHNNTAGWNNQPAIVHFEELTNVHIDWEEVPDGNFVEKRNLLLASNDLPDLFMRARLSATDQVIYASNGQLVALDALFDYAPYFSEMMANNAGIAKCITMPDGHIYALPQINTTDGNLINNYFINTVWLDALGLEMPTNLEEFHDVLAAFVTGDPNQNGEADEIGYAGSALSNSYDLFINFYGSFGFGGNHGIINGFFDIDDDDKVRLIAIQDKYKELLIYFNILWSENLIDKDSFAQNYQTVSAKCALNQVGFVSYGNNTQWIGATRADFAQPPVLAGSNGDNYWVNVSGNVQTVGTAAITSANRYPEATMRYLDYFYSEHGTVTIRMGIEGESYYIDVDGSYKLFDYIKHDPNGLTQDQAVGKYGIMGGGNVPQNISDRVDQSAAQLPETKADVETIRATGKLVPYEAITKLSYTEDEAVDLSRYETDILSYIKENSVKFITGEREFSEWDQYVQTLKSMNLDEYIAIYQAAYDRWNS